MLKNDHRDGPRRWPSARKRERYHVQTERKQQRHNQKEKYQALGVIGELKDITIECGQ